MIDLTVGVTPATAASPARLRADAIQRETLIQIGRILAEGDTGARDLIDALEDLGRLAVADRRDGELDAALDDVATYAHLDAAVMPLTREDVQQLADQAQAALPQAATVVHLPQQQDRRAS